MAYSTATPAEQLGRIEQALAEGGDRPAGSVDWRLHEAVRGPFQYAVTEVHELLLDRLADRPDVKRTSRLGWLIRRAVEEGLISDSDAATLQDALQSRNTVAHVFPPDTINQMIPAVQRFLPVAWCLTSI